MADALFEEPRLARIYDAVDGDRTPLDTYVSLIESLGARSALDIGCGTGTLACRLAARGLDVTAVDPAAASLDIARLKPHADRVRWLKGDATTLPPLAVDVATMTANVAQVFLTDEDWASALGGCHGALRPGGRLLFEVRDPLGEAWRGWNRAQSFRRLDIDGVVDDSVQEPVRGGELARRRRLRRRKRPQRSRPPRPGARVPRRSVRHRESFPAREPQMTPEDESRHHDGAISCVAGTSDRSATARSRDGNDLRPVERVKANRNRTLASDAHGRV